MRRRRIQIALGVALGVTLLLAITFRVLEQRFDAHVAQAERRVGSTVASGDRSQLPALALEYLARAGVESNGNPRVVRLGQSGRIRSRPDAPWKAFSAVQRLAVRDVGYTWFARTRAAPGIDIEILDQLGERSTCTEVRLLGAFPLSDAMYQQGRRAQIQRYLAELVWAPHAVRDNAALELVALGDHRLQVAAGDGAERASVEMELDEHGDIVRSVAMRPHRENGTVVERRWVAELSRHDRLGPIRIPTHGELRWELPSGHFVYLRGNVESIEFD